LDGGQNICRKPLGKQCDHLLTIQEHRTDDAENWHQPRHKRCTPLVQRQKTSGRIAKRQAKDRGVQRCFNLRQKAVNMQKKRKIRQGSSRRRLLTQKPQAGQKNHKEDQECCQPYNKRECAFHGAHNGASFPLLMDTSGAGWDSSSPDKRAT